MIKIKYSLIAFGFICFLISCKQIKTEIKQDEIQNSNHYVSIDGLWRVTPETAIRYPHGTLEPIFQIRGNAYGKTEVRGCFIWEGRFYDYWDLHSVHFEDSSRQIVLKYDDNGVYKGVVDPGNEIIQGIAYWDENDTTDWDKINFIRDEVTEIAKLFIPYPSCDDGSIKYIYHIPEECNDQLQPASIFQYIDDTSAFYNLMGRIIRQEFGRIESLLIIKDQKLVLEEYFFGYDRNQLHYINSCTKSITSLLLGISLNRHNQSDVDQPLFNFFPEYDSLKTSGKEKITLKHVMTMTAGFQDENDFSGTIPEDFIKYLLTLPLESIPGEKFRYSGECTNILGGLIYTIENKQADEFAEEVLFNKLGISEFDWERENGIVHCDAGLCIYPRDMTKVGLLVLNKGVWQGEQIVPEEWIDISTKPHVAESEFFDYGFQWWHRSKQNIPWWKNPKQGGNTEYDMTLALGHGGQYIMIINDLNMVIAITSSDNNESNGKCFTKVPMVIENIVPLFD